MEPRRRTRTAGRRRGIDVSTYGFSTHDGGGGVLGELDALASQVKAIEKKVGVSATTFWCSVDVDGIGSAHVASAGAWSDDETFEQKMPSQVVSGAVGCTASLTSRVVHGSGDPLSYIESWTPA
ncbi:hypothetical protein CYMTET_51299 [Cymbomonas tetramitiformis]|uniref:Uncharacterized protein n=1 Tax=Cymbomonas tetramitiformis TaxID=36881 RepID=A0AAE0BMW5_9CHLO|nr:hypothetical protein CYMTET_51299 [Cymbomonas tetramitiformis]